MTIVNNAHKTAIYRKRISAPVSFLIRSGKFVKSDCFNILDFGCGHGKDVEVLNSNGYFATGFDPHWNNNNKDCLNIKYDAILCTYVFNVLDVEKQKKLMAKIKNLTKPNGVAYITVRRDIKKDTITKKGTEQFVVNLPLKIIKKTNSYCVYELCPTLQQGE